MLMSVMMINVKSSKDFRSGIQNGFWGIKYALVIGGLVGAVGLRISLDTLRTNVLSNAMSKMHFRPPNAYMLTASI